jgi:hypothetical protein
MPPEPEYPPVLPCAPNHPDAVWRELAAAVLGKPVESVTLEERARACTAFWDAWRSVDELPGRTARTGLMRLLAKLAEHSVLEGLDAVAQARVLIATGRVAVQDANLVTQAMWHLSTEGAGHRIERLALAGALIAMELEKEAARGR